MSRDFKITLGILGGLAAAAFAGFLVWSWFVGPWMALGDRLEQLDEAVLDKRLELVRLHKKLAKLNDYRRRSLPEDETAAVSQYHRYLRNVLTKAGLEVYMPEGRVEKQRASLRQRKLVRAKNTKPIYRMVRFSGVLAYGSLRSLAAALYELQETPLLQKIKSLSVEPEDRKSAGRGRLKINLTMEALIIEGAGHRLGSLVDWDERLVAAEVLSGMRGAPTGLPLAVWALSPAGPLAPQQLAMMRPDRLKYGLIAEKDVFRGYQPPPPPPKKEDTEAPVDEGPDMRQYTFLSQITHIGEDGVAYLRNKLYRSGEPGSHIRLRDSGLFRTFELKNLSLEKVQLKGTVIKIDYDSVIFMVEENETGENFRDYYRIELGQTLADAMRHRLRPDELAKLGIQSEEEP